MDNVDITIKAGEIHALLGENGAGKSTLMQILCGFLQPDTGKITVNGVPHQFKTPANALALRIGMVRQRPELAAQLKIWEYCLLGAESRVSLLAPYRRGGRERVKALDALWNFGLPLDALCGSLSAAEKQLTAVLALLVHGADFLIFDEPTAVLGKAESEKLFQLWKHFAAEKRGIVIISHKLEETLALADCGTVLRRGKVRGGFQKDGVEPRRILDLMFDTAPREKRMPAARAASLPVKAEALFEVKGLSVEEAGFPFLRDIQFSVYAGEITGIAGVKESGIGTLELALTGFLRAARGAVTLNGVNIAGKGALCFRRAGGAYVNAGRTELAPGRGIAAFDAALSLRENLMIHAHRRFERHGKKNTQKLPVFNQKALDAWIRALLSQAEITRPLETPAGALSGGMLQRLLFRREWAEEPRVIILSEPAWGLDRQREERFFEALREYAALGRAVILFSTDSDKLLAAANRILVLYDGVCVEDRVLAAGQAAEEDTEALAARVREAMTGWKASVC